MFALGATTVKQLEENVAAAEVELTAGILEKIDTILGEPPTGRFKFQGAPNVIVVRM